MSFFLRQSISSRSLSATLARPPVKSLIIGVIILATSYLFVDLQIAHPLAMFAFLILTCLSFSLLGFIIGIWASNFEQLQLIPLLVLTPLGFLGGTFYSITMLPPVWQTITLFNPVVYLVSGFRWSFFGTSDVSIGVSLFAICAIYGDLPWHCVVDFQNGVSFALLNRTV
jgi:ABC-2 type transport system permease protein